MATLSLCMIVRDEAQMLPRFFAMADALWDELIVVDTGSTDNTVDIAKEAGARVLHYTWTDDFAAARNVGLEAATSDWVAYFDADEFLSPQAVQEIRKKVDDPTVGAIRVPIVNTMPGGHEHITYLLRAFRRDPSIRFRFPIHEEVISTVEPYLTANGLRTTEIHGPVNHEGYVREVAAAKGKKHRDQSILEKAIQNNADDVYSWFKLLELANFWDDKALMRRHADGALRALKRADALWLADFRYAGEMLTLIDKAQRPKFTLESVSFLNQWEARIKPSAAFLLHRGMALESLGGLNRAVADFTACLHLKTTENRQLAQVRPLLGLARIAIARRKFEQGLGHAKKALYYAPQDLEALVCALVLTGVRQGAAHRIKFAEDHIHRHGDSLLMRECVAQAAMLAGDMSLAAKQYGILAGHPPSGPAAIELARALFGQGQISQCHDLCMALLDDEPEAGVGVLVCNLSRGRDTQIGIQMEHDEVQNALQRWVSVLKFAPRHVVRGFKAYVGALEPMFPGISAQL